MTLLRRSRTSDRPTTAPAASADPLPLRRRGPGVILAIGHPAFCTGLRVRVRPFRLFSPAACTLMARGRRGLLRCCGGGGDPSTPAGPAGVGGLEQERGGGQARSLGLLLVLPGGFFVRTVLYVRIPIVGVVGTAGTVSPLALDLQLRLSLCCVRDRHDARHDTLRLIGLADLRAGDVRFGGRGRLGGGRGRDDLAPTARRDCWSDRGGRGLGLFRVGIIGSRGGDGACGVSRGRLLGSGSLSRGGGSGGGPAATTRSRGAHGVTDRLVLLV
mgnify:CR=1 FL=1